MALVEYLYVDERRLGSYVEQIASPVTFEKVPVWTAKLSLSGPAAEGSQKRYPRPLTRPEKIDRLLEFLKKHGHLGQGRFHGREVFGESARLFRLETCEAVKVFIPPAAPESLVSYHPDDTFDRQQMLKEDNLEFQRRLETLRRGEREQASGVPGKTSQGFPD